MRPLRSLLALTALALAVATPGAAAEGGMTPAQIDEQVRKAMDSKADPCSDFYRYACGGWLDTTTIPSDESSWGRGFDEINIRNRTILKETLEELAKNPGNDPDDRRLGAFYGACMDEAAIEKTGTAPLKPYLDRIATAKDAASVMKVAGEMERDGVGVFLNTEVDGDFKDPTLAIVHMFQGGMGLPSRDYYFPENDEGKAILKDYQAYVATMLGLLGTPGPEAAAQAAAILAFETEMARSAKRPVEMRDLEKLYNKIDVAGLKTLAPGLDWDGWLAALGFPALRDVNVATPDFFKNLQEVVARTQPATLQAYLRLRTAGSFANQLPKAFVETQFGFYGRRLTGQQEIQPRWRRCTNFVDAALGESLGRAFVARAFPGDSKAKALDMVTRIEAAFEANLPSLAWMDATTRGRAVAKVKAITNKIGYPDKWRDYSAINADPKSHFANVVAARRFESRREYGKVGKPVDRLEWGMTPPEVNAYYNPLNNEMVFPAGIMQRPFFDRAFPPPMNFGGMGMVVGHELTHGFDDQGRKFDPQGRLLEWWEPSVAESFEERAQCVENQYSALDVEPGLKANGALTLGENIADNGGVKQAYMAFKAWQSEAGRPPAAKVAGLTEDQLFFVGFAQTWCEKATPEIERVLTNTNPHSLPRFRVNVPLGNFPGFSETFQCKAGSPMRPEKTCEVW